MYNTTSINKMINIYRGFTNKYILSQKDIY